MVDLTGDLEVTEDGALTVRAAMEPLGVLTISTHGREDLVSGSVKVVSDGPIGGLLRFDLPGIGVAGVGASQPVSDAIVPVRRQEDGDQHGGCDPQPGIESGAGALRLDAGGRAARRSPRASLWRPTGRRPGSSTRQFPAADTSDFAGSVRCDAVGEGRFSAVALEMDPGNRIFTTLPVVPVPERMSQE